MGSLIVWIGELGFMAPLKKILAALLLMAFLAVKGGFWLAMNSPQKLEDKPTTHACACTGEPVCRCGPEGCCASESNVSFGTDGPQVHSPKVCGSFSKGIGPLADVLGLPTPEWSWIPESLSGENLSSFDRVTLLSNFDPPEPPVPRV